LYYNQPENFNTYGTLISFNYCCTTPLPAYGAGNLASEPQFVNLGEGNLRLQTISPCLNSGNNGYVSGQTDLDGNPRIYGPAVDIGAYELQSQGAPTFSSYLQYYRLPMDGSADYVDSDGDTLNNRQEWRCQTNPTNADSALRFLAPVSDGSSVTLRWQSVAGVPYFVERSTNFENPPVFSSCVTNLVGQDGITTYSFTNHIAAPRSLFRVGVGN
jgi:hypothetical protein